MEKAEIRSFGGDAAPKIEGRRIEGYAVVFNEWSEVLYDAENKRFFKEMIKPEAITDELLMRSDVKAVIEHNRERLLARYNKGGGTLSLSLNERGLSYSFDAPNTQDGDFAIEMINRGDMNGSSFKFGVLRGGGENWSKRPDGIWERSITSIRFLADVTITTDPAYTQTDVNVRSIQDMERPDEEVDNPYKVKLKLLKSRI